MQLDIDSFFKHHPVKKANQTVIKFYYSIEAVETSNNR